MTYAVKDFRLVQGEGFSRAMTITSDGSAVNLTGYTITAEVRLTPTTGGSAAATFTTSITNAANGQFSISLTGTQTAALSDTGGIYYYDLKLKPSGGEPRVYMTGRILVRARVTTS
jgi:hypothetical protein